MKKKGIFLCSLIMVALFTCFTSVEAKSYTIFKKGDEITVNLNNSLKEKFYVIENNNDTVTAIYKDVLGEEFKTDVKSTETIAGTEIEKRLKNLTSTWTNATNIRLIKADEIVSGFDPNSDKITITSINDKMYNIGKSYWTQTLKKNGSVDSGYRYYPVPVKPNGSFSSFILDVESADASGTESTVSSAAIRPVITVSKNNIEGGTYLSEDERIWKEFVEKYTTYAKTLEDTTDGNQKVNITSTENTLTIVVTHSFGKYSNTTKFTYANGIVTYVPAATNDDAMWDSILVGMCINTLAEIKGYNIEQLTKFLQTDRKYDFATDGIEFKTVGSEKGAPVHMTLDAYTAYDSFKLDIKNGIKTFTNETAKEQVVKNPKTGIMTVSIGLISVLIIGMIVYLKTKKYSKFPQA